MARKVDIRNLLRFRDSRSEPRTEQPNKKEEEEATSPKPHRDHFDQSPFQRVKLAADCFLAADIMPLGRAVN